jgi:hypothetical protein
MAKKLARVFRDRRLTPNEITVDRDVREKVRAEYPPRGESLQKQGSTLSELLKRTIRESGKSVDALAGESGVSAALIAGFLTGERDIHLRTADRLANSLGLEVSAE